MLTRVFASVVTGAVVTFVLLFAMQRMIAGGREVMTASETPRIIDFVRVEREAVVETRKERPERPPEPAEQPDLPQPDVSLGEADGLVVGVAAPTFDIGTNVRAGPAGISDGEYLPIVKVAPAYPVRALMHRIEGYVVLVFTVTAAGTVKDVRVVESSTPLFEQAAIDAALKFRYKPRVIDGAPVEVSGVLNRIVFAMDRGREVAMSE